MTYIDDDLVIDPSLPVIQNCDGCGACCLEIDSPPGYSIVFGGCDPNGELRDDHNRYYAMPQKLRDELEMYYRRNRDLGDRNAPIPSGRPCVWLNLATMKCRHHEWRPDICREFSVGSDACRGWRETYEIDE